MNILVTGAGVTHSLPVIRALGRQGHRVVAASSHPRAHGLYSRFVSERFIHPPVSTDPMGFVDAIREKCRAAAIHRIVPLFEETLPLARWADGHLGGLLTVSPYDTLMTFHDKRLLCLLAKRTGTPTPPTWFPLNGSGDGEGDWRGLPGDFPFPAILKAPQASGSRWLLPVAKREDLEGALRRWRGQGMEKAPPILQGRIIGETLSTLGFAWRGRVKGLVVYRGIGHYPVTGGVAVVRERVEHPAIQASARALMEATGFHGVLGLDFVVGTDGVPRLIDGNPRLTPGFSLATDGGLDLVSMITSGTEGSVVGVTPGPLSRLSEIVAVRYFKHLLPGGGLSWKQALDTFRAARRARPELYDWGDVASLRGLGAFAIDGTLSALGRGPTGVHRIGGYQYTDLPWADRRLAAGGAPW